MSTRTYSQSSGFTIIEMMVALAIFAMVVTTTVGALLVLIAGNSALQSEQAVMNNLSFVMDNMTREIRTGTSYYCGRSNGSPTEDRVFDDPDAIGVNEVNDCSTGGNSGSAKQGVSIVETGNSISDLYGGGGRISYYYDRDAENIYRRVGSNAPEPLVSSNVRIVHAEFFVTGTMRAIAPGGDMTQPSVTIFIEAEDATGAVEDPFYLQTTVSQRRLDL